MIPPKYIRIADETLIQEREYAGTASCVVVSYQSLYFDLDYSRPEQTWSIFYEPSRVRTVASLYYGGGDSLQAALDGPLVP